MDQETKKRFREAGVFVNAIWYPREDNENDNELKIKILKVIVRGRKPKDALIIYRTFRLKGMIDLITEASVDWMSTWFEYKPKTPK